MKCPKDIVFKTFYELRLQDFPTVQTFIFKICID